MTVKSHFEGQKLIHCEVYERRLGREKISRSRASKAQVALRVAKIILGYFL
jgi:hypothetical protein